MHFKHMITYVHPEDIISQCLYHHSEHYVAKTLVVPLAFQDNILHSIFKPNLGTVIYRNVGI